MALRQGPVEKFRSREQEATLGLLRTADAIKRHFSQVIERHGITLQQYNVLRILRGAGPDGLPTLTIGERMIADTRSHPTRGPPREEGAGEQVAM